MNTNQMFDKNTASYGLDLTKQTELLNKMNQFALNMRVHGKKSMLPFQKGKGIFYNNIYSHIILK